MVSRTYQVFCLLLLLISIAVLVSESLARALSWIYYGFLEVQIAMSFRMLWQRGLLSKTPNQIKSRIESDGNPVVGIVDGLATAVGFAAFLKLQYWNN